MTATGAGRVSPCCAFGNPPAERDDPPELTDADLARGVWRIGERRVSREEATTAIAKRRAGRPRGSSKTSTTIRFDHDVLEAFRSGGPGWQSRINAALRDWLRQHPMT